MTKMSEDNSLDHWQANYREDDVFWDIGAYQGLYTEAVGDIRSYLFEPHPIHYERLHRDYRGIDDVTVLPTALWDERELREFTLTDPRGENTNHIARPDRSHEASTTVLTDSVDRLIADVSIVPPTVLKIDVEGAEQHVLDGANQTLTDGVRLLYLEVHQASTGTGELPYYEIPPDNPITTIREHGFEVVDQYEIDDIVRLIAERD